MPAIPAVPPGRATPAVMAGRRRPPQPLSVPVPGTTPITDVPGAVGELIGMPTVEATLAADDVPVAPLPLAGLDHRRDTSLDVVVVSEVPDPPDVGEAWRRSGWNEGWDQRIRRDCPPELLGIVLPLVRARVAEHAMPAATPAALRRAARRAGASQSDADAWAQSTSAGSWTCEALARLPQGCGITELQRLIGRVNSQVHSILSAGPVSPLSVAPHAPSRPTPPTGPQPRPAATPKSAGTPSAGAPRAKKKSKKKSKTKVVTKRSAEKVPLNVKLNDLVAADNARAAAIAALRPHVAPRALGFALAPPKPNHGQMGEPEKDVPGRPRGWQTTDWINSKS